MMTYQTFNVGPSSVSSYAQDLAEMCFAGARPGGCVALLVDGPEEAVAVEAAIYAQLRPGETTTVESEADGYWKKICVSTGGEIQIVSHPAELYGEYHLVVSGSVALDSDLVVEARKRLVVVT